MYFMVFYYKEYIFCFVSSFLTFFRILPNLFNCKNVDGYHFLCSAGVCDGSPGPWGSTPSPTAVPGTATTAAATAVSGRVADPHSFHPYLDPAF